MMLLIMASSPLKSVAVNTNPGFVAQVIRLEVEIRLPTPMEAMMVPSSFFAAVAAAVAAASASALVEPPLGSPSVRRIMR